MQQLTAALRSPPRLVYRLERTAEMLHAAIDRRIEIAQGIKDGSVHVKKDRFVFHVSLFFSRFARKLGIEIPGQTW